LILEKNLCIKKLDISGCNLQDQGVRVLSVGLRINQTVEDIDMGDNKLTDKV
jgi:hypothetical protein